jgi:starch phosphorylase
MNGVLNLSTLDGWWPEGCRHGETGWQFGDAYTGYDQDQHDLQCLYRVLLDEVLSTYYENQSRWTAMMRKSIDMSHWQFSSTRMLHEYIDRMYVLEKESHARKCSIA